MGGRYPSLLHKYSHYWRPGNMPLELATAILDDARYHVMCQLSVSCESQIFFFPRFGRVHQDTNTENSRRKRRK
jgi:hypothetical protein